VTIGGFFFLLLFGLPSTVLALAIFLVIWLSVGKSKPFRAGLLCFGLAALPIIWLRSLPPDELGAPGAGFVYVALIGPLTLAVVSLIAGIVIGFRVALSRANRGAR
jgi:hypothetical protein